VAFPPKEARMKTHIHVAAACVALAATGAFADHTATHCGKSAAADGMRARVATIQAQIDKLELTADRAEQRALAELNMKHLQEAVTQLRKRELSPGCRIELMSSLLEALVRNQQVALAEPAR
jgi:hypothetical protein